MYKGSYIRVYDGDRHLSQYEIDRLVEDKTKPSHDTEIIEEAVLKVLNGESEELKFR